MTDEDERRFLRGLLAFRREPRPHWLKEESITGLDHIGRDDVWWPDSRGIAPEAKLVRRELERKYRLRRDGADLKIRSSVFLKVLHAVEELAYSHPALTPRERIEAIQFVASDRFEGLEVPAEDIERWLDLNNTARETTLRLFGLHYGVSPRRIKTPRKP